MVHPDLPRITIPRERCELLSGCAADYSLKRPSRQLRQLPNGVDTDLRESCGGDQPHSPHQLDREIVKEIQLGLGIDNDQPVRLGHLRGNFREVLGARHADRNWQAKLGTHTMTDCSRDLRRRTEKVRASRNVSKCLVDRNPLDEGSEIIEHIDGSIAQPLVILEMLVGPAEER
jgi:hypothetical protein